MLPPPTLADHVREFSKGTYKYLSEVFGYKLGMAEIGITDIFTFSIIDYCTRTKALNVKIYQTGAKVESLYGNDIDLFIQRSDGKYQWYALQAKVMSENGAYEDLKLKLGINQWDKLLLHEKQFDSESFYLLYNGKHNGRKGSLTPTRIDCLGSPSIEEHGLGIVKTSDIKTVRHSKRAYQKVYFRDLFPTYMDSIRKLFCCPPATSSGKGYQQNEIYTGAPYHAVTVATPRGDDSISDSDDLDQKQALFSETASLFLASGAAPMRIVVSDLQASSSR